MLKGTIWFAWFRFQVNITIALWRIGAPSWVCGLPGALMFWRWSDYWRAHADARFVRIVRYCWRRKFGSRIYRINFAQVKRN